MTEELAETSPRSATPPWIKTPLLPHQQAALHAATALEQAKTEGIAVNGSRLFTSYGILGDAVGCGKSLIALALVNTPAPSPVYTEYITRSGGRIGDGRDVGVLQQRTQLLQSVTNLPLHPVTTSLFIVPHVVMSQWEAYVRNDTTLRVRFVKTRAEATATNLLETLEEYDAVVVSSTMYSTLRAAHPIHGILWKRIFIDEADSISITTRADELNALFYWFITASWMNLAFPSGANFNVSGLHSPLPETNVDVVRRVMDRITGSNYLSIAGMRHINVVRQMCGGCSQLGQYSIHINQATILSAKLIIRAADEFVRASFVPPTIDHQRIICATPPNIRALDAFISTDMMERLHAGDIHGALGELGMTAGSESEVAAAVTASFEKEAAAMRRTLEYKQTVEYSSEAAKERAIAHYTQKLASIEQRISAIRDRLAKSHEQTCPICCCDVSGAAVTPCCAQLFCFSCLCESLRRTPACPLCRARIEDVKSIQVVAAGGASATAAGGAGATVAPTPPVRMTKSDTCLEFLRTHRDARVLMFSMYDASFALLERRMAAEGITFAVVNGSQARVAKLLAEFAEGKYNVLFLNARNMGAGLNIVCATHVLLYHKMSKELTDQIVGRAIRLGRAAPLTVVHLLHTNELDVGSA